MSNPNGSSIGDIDADDSYGYESDYLLDSPCGYDDSEVEIGLTKVHSQTTQVPAVQERECAPSICSSNDILRYNDDNNDDVEAVSASKRMKKQDESSDDKIVLDNSERCDTPTGLLESIGKKLAEVCDSDDQHPLIIEMYRECGTELSEFLMALSRKTIKLTTQPPKLLRTNRYQQNSIIKSLHSNECLLTSEMKQNIISLNEKCSKYGNMETIPMAYYLARIVCYLNKFFGHINITQICSIGIYAVISAMILLIRFCEKGNEIRVSLTSRNIHRLLMTSILVSAKQLCRVQKHQIQQNQQLLKIDHLVWMKVVGIESENEIVELEKMYFDCFETNELVVSHDLVYKLTISTEADIEMQRYFDGDSEIDSEDEDEEDYEDDDEEENTNGYDEDENAGIDELIESDDYS